MKLKHLTSFILFTCSVLYSGALYGNESGKAIHLSDELQIEQIIENTFLVTHRFPWPANSLLVRYPDRCIIWVDTPYTDDATEQVWKWIRSTIGKEKIIGINTGFHCDNLGGNGFLYTKSVDIYGTDLTVKLLSGQAEKTRSQIMNWLKKPSLQTYYDAHSKAQYYPPNTLFAIKPNEGVYLLDGLLEVFYPGPSHSQDNLTVYFPDRKLLFGGCAVKSAQSKNLGFTGDAVMSEWPISLENILDRYKNAQLVVPGHGRVGGLELIRHTLSLL